MGEVSKPKRSLSEPSRIAALLESLPPSERAAVWQAQDAATQGAVLVRVHRQVRRQLIEASSAAQLQAAVVFLDLDDLSDIDDLLPVAVIEAILGAMDGQRRARFDVVRSYPDDSAGGLMDVDAIAVRPDISLAMVVEYLVMIRAQSDRVPTDLEAIHVTDLAGHYLGRLQLVDLVTLAPTFRVREVMDSTFVPVEASLHAAKVARRFEEDELISAPVVNASGILIGRITADDVLDHVLEQGERAALVAVGLEVGADTFAPAWTSARGRALWLGINLVNAMLAAVIIGLFESTIEHLVALAVLMPVVTSMGGVAGTQSMTLVVRGLALEQVHRGNRWFLLRREVGVALINSLAWALVVGWVSYVWYGNRILSLIFAAAITLNLIAGTVLGTTIPFLLKKLKIDAALAGGVLLVAFTDSLGFFLFLGMAAVFMR
jgi:magnesium transporter